MRGASTLRPLPRLRCRLITQIHQRLIHLFHRLHARVWCCGVTKVVGVEDEFGDGCEVGVAGFVAEDELQDCRVLALEEKHHQDKAH